MNTTETIANRILADAGLRPSDAVEAKRRIDARLTEMGAPPSIHRPVPLLPGASLVGRTTAGVVSELISGREKEIVQPHVELYNPDATFGPDDFSPAVACTSLGTTAAGGTEVKFQSPGIVYVGAGPVGVYWTRALGSSQNNRWTPVMSGVRLPYNGKNGLFFGTNTVGGIAVGGCISFALYQLPKEHVGKPGAWAALHKQVQDWTEGSSDATGTAGVLGFIFGGGPASGTDVTLGTFSDAGGGTQIFKVGTNMPVGGAVNRSGAVILNASPANNDVCWIGETGALRVASNGGIGPSG